MTLCLDGLNEKGIIYGTEAWNIGDIKETKTMNLALEIGKTI
jgi:hypothetical protein